VSIFIAPAYEGVTKHRIRDHKDEIPRAPDAMFDLEFLICGIKSGVCDDRYAKFDAQFAIFVIHLAPAMPQTPSPVFHSRKLALTRLFLPC
jgi:hypothetical protein